jgi:hypothetical protein
LDKSASTLKNIRISYYYPESGLRMLSRGFQARRLTVPSLRGSSSRRYKVLVQCSSKQVRYNMTLKETHFNIKQFSNMPSFQSYPPILALLLLVGLVDFLLRLHVLSVLKFLGYIIFLRTPHDVRTVFFTIDPALTQTT